MPAAGSKELRSVVGEMRVLVIPLYRMPESRSAFCKIVSLTAAKTRRMLPVSVACVRLRD